MQLTRRALKYRVCRSRILLLGLAITFVALVFALDAVVKTYPQSYVLPTEKSKILSNLESNDFIPGTTLESTKPKAQSVEHDSPRRQATFLQRTLKIPTRKTASESFLKVPTRKTENLLSVTTTAQAMEGNAKDASTDTENVNNNQYEVTIDCLPRTDLSDVKTPYKIYVYNLPPYFNKDIQRSMTDENRFAYCYNLDYCGTGEELYQLGNDTKPSSTSSILSVRNTQQFALETLIHYKMLNSPFRTIHPEKADAFYIPAYSGLNCLQFTGNSKEFVDNLFNYLTANESVYFNSDKPHLLTLSKIQREQGSDNCPMLKHQRAKNITFIGIEKEANPHWISSSTVTGKTVLVAPYPSYVHYLPNIRDNSLYEFDTSLTFLNKSKFYLDTPNLYDRSVLLFLAAGTRRSNHFRAQLLDQFPVQTHDSYEEMAEAMELNNETMPEQVMLITSECSEKHRVTTIPWMRKSKYCLQPPGDSPTRKSIYDSILSGCIPVLFTNQYKVEYPFQNILDYSDFTHTIDTDILTNKSVLEVIQEIPKKQTRIYHRNLRRVAKWFQYSLSNADINNSDDAFTLILHEIAVRHNLY